jgi:hypothetical protein
VTGAADVEGETVYRTLILSIEGHEAPLLPGYHQVEQLTVILNARVVNIHVW